jgi:polyadenylate-binding protein 2
VGNAHYASSTEEIREFFIECGVIERVTIPLNRYTQLKGFVYLEFADVSGVAKAQALNDSIFKSQELSLLSVRISLALRAGLTEVHPKGVGFYRFRPH